MVLACKVCSNLGALCEINPFFPPSIFNTCLFLLLPFGALLEPRPAVIGQREGDSLDKLPVLPAAICSYTHIYHQCRVSSSHDVYVCGLQEEAGEPAENPYRHVRWQCEPLHHYINLDPFFIDFTYKLPWCYVFVFVFYTRFIHNF